MTGKLWDNFQPWKFW